MIFVEWHYIKNLYLYTAPLREFRTRSGIPPLSMHSEERVYQHNGIVCYLSGDADRG